MTTLYLEGGPFFIARRLPGASQWQVCDQGYATKAEVDAEIAASPKEYEYSWIDIRDIKPTQVSRTTGTKQ